MGYTTAIVQVLRRGGVWRRRLRYHWRPEDYAEDEDHLRQDGIYQPTNAPRWCNRGATQSSTHLVIGTWTGGAYQHLESLAEAEARLGRTLGLAQMKLVSFDQVSEAQELVFTCELGDGTTEQRTVVLGPELEPEDIVPLVRVNRLSAEQKQWPYRGTGQYRDVPAVQRITGGDPGDLSFEVAADVPFLHGESGVAVRSLERTQFAVQLDRSWGEPHLFDDAVGQVFLHYVEEGDVWFRRRTGAGSAWGPPRQVTGDGDSTEPWAEKDDRGLTVLARQRGGTEVEVLWSPDDGRQWRRA